METRKPYPSDLSNAEWALLEPLVPTVKEGGRNATYSRREIVNAIFYVTRTGCAWRYVPHDLPPWSLAHYYFWHWKKSGVWPKINDALRGKLRQKLGREEQPTAAVMDSQSVKTTEKGGPRGFDGGKLIKGRKRHLLTDTQGFLLKVFVTPANAGDPTVARMLLWLAWYWQPLLKLVWADCSYRGPLLAWAKQTLGWTIEIIPPPEKGKGFQLAARRWVVERTFAWLGKWRHHSKDYEQTTKSSETFISIAMSAMMLRRLARD